MPSLAGNEQREADQPGTEVVFPITGSDREDHRGAVPSLAATPDAFVAPMVFAGVVSRKECQEVIAYARKLPSHEGRMADLRGDYRRSTVAWIDPSPDAIWLYQKLATTFRAVNRWYRYDIVGFVEMLQFTIYEPGGRFGWHMDTGRGRMSTRKLSLSLQLTDGDAYSGGELEFCGLGPLGHSRDIGTVVVFPSFLAHRVTRLASGTRHVLVAWAHGPAFR